MSVLTFIDPNTPNQVECVTRTVVRCNVNSWCDTRTNDGSFYTHPVKSSVLKVGDLRRSGLLRWHPPRESSATVGCIPTIVGSHCVEFINARFMNTYISLHTIDACVDSIIDSYDTLSPSGELLKIINEY